MIAAESAPLAIVPGAAVAVYRGHHASLVYRLSPRLDGRVGEVVSLTGDGQRARVRFAAPEGRKARVATVALAWLCALGAQGEIRGDRFWQLDNGARSRQAALVRALAGQLVASARGRGEHEALAAAVALGGWPALLPELHGETRDLAAQILAGEGR